MCVERCPAPASATYLSAQRLPEVLLQHPEQTSLDLCLLLRFPRGGIQVVHSKSCSLVPEAGKDVPALNNRRALRSAADRQGDPWVEMCLGTGNTSRVLSGSDSEDSAKGLAWYLCLAGYTALLVLQVSMQGSMLGIRVGIREGNTLTETTQLLSTFTMIRKISPRDTRFCD